MTSRTYSRRTVLQAGALGAVGTAGGSLLWSQFASGSAVGVSATGQPVPGSPVPGPRILVVVELAGGNDGLSTLVPFESGRYHDLRPELALGESDVVDWGNGWGIASSLDPLTAYGLTALTGIGTRTPDLSHFEMQARWAAGDPESIPTRATGFFGRLCDAVHEGSPLTGISIAESTSSAMIAERASTVGVNSGNGPGLLHEGSDQTQAAMRRAFDEMISTRTGPSAGLAGGFRQALQVDDILSSLPDPIERDNETAFGSQLRLALQLIRSEVGVRVIHVQMGGGDFDTHSDHAGRHARNMESLGTSLANFSEDLAVQGLAERVLIATTSEFGRRPRESENGLDHGTASTVLLSGPVAGGIWGEHSSLDDLDEDENLVATMSFDRYYASLATWLDVDPAQVLERRADPIDGLITL